MTYKTLWELCLSPCLSKEQQDSCEGKINEKKLLKSVKSNKTISHQEHRKRHLAQNNIHKVAKYTNKLKAFEQTEFEVKR